MPGLQRSWWVLLIALLMGLLAQPSILWAADQPGDVVLYSDTDTISAEVLKRGENLVLDTCSTGNCAAHNLTAIDNPPEGECRVVGGYGIGSLWVNTETGSVFRCVGPFTDSLARWITDSPSMTLQTICDNGGCQFTDLPPERPLRIAPSGLAQMRLEFKQGGTGLVEECIDAGGTTCQPPNILLNPGDQVCVNAILGAPASELPIECWTNTDGTSANFTRNDRGAFASRPQASYPHQTYLVTDCLTAACTAGAGTIRALTRWTGSAWVVDWTSAGGGGGANTRRVTAPLRLMTVDGANANAFQDSTAGTNFDWAGVTFVDTGTGCANFKHQLPSNVATTPAWTIRLAHKAVSGAGGNAVLTVSAKSFGNNEAFDAALSALITTTTVPVSTSANTTLSIVPSSGDNDAEEPLVSNELLIVRICRVALNGNDTVGASWRLLNADIAYATSE